MYSEYIYSIEDVWVIWILSTCTLATLIYFALRSENWKSLRQFASDEGGASYALPYLMAFPFYLMIVCCTVQATLIILTKIGVMHAAHNAARAAVVWRSSHPSDASESLKRAEDHAFKAAANTMASFSSGYDGHQQLWKWDVGRWQKGVAAVPGSYVYAKIYEDMASHTDAKNSLAKTDYVRRKYVLANAMTKVNLRDHQNNFNSQLSVDVSYRMPIHIPGAGQIMGKMHWTQKGYYRDIEARATLPLESPESANRHLGIEYDPAELETLLP